jgi:hypothetical protein
MNEQDEKVAHPGNGISTSRTTAFRPIWQFAMDRLISMETVYNNPSSRYRLESILGDQREQFQ